MTIRAISRDPCGLVILGDRTPAQSSLDVLDHGSLDQVPRVVLATSDATTAEIAAVQLPRLQGLNPTRVVLQLGGRDLVDGYDESYFHARVVEICDAIAHAAPDAEVGLVAIPPFSSGPEPSVSPELAALRRQCNAAAEITAQLRHFRWWQDLSTATPRRPARP